MTTSEPVAFDAEKENLILDAVERFVDREIKPVAQRLEHADEWPADIVAGMRDMGLFGCIIREEYGGLGLSASTYAKVVERIARVWMSVSGIINSTAAPTCRRCARWPGATATTTSSTAPRPGYPTASMARPLPCWSRPIPRPSRATAA